MDGFVTALRTGHRFSDAFVMESIAALSRREQCQLAYIVHGTQRSWALELVRDGLVAAVPNLPVNVSRVVRYDIATTGEYVSAAAELEAEHADGPRPALDLVGHVEAPLGQRAIAMYRNREYAQMARSACARLSDAEAMELFYTRFSPSWNPLASTWLYKCARPNTAVGRRSMAAFEMHYWALQERVDAIKRDRPDEARAIAANLRPTVAAQATAAKAARVPKVPKVLQQSRGPRGARE